MVDEQQFAKAILPEFLFSRFCRRFDNTAEREKSVQEHARYFIIVEKDIEAWVRNGFNVFKAIEEAGAKGLITGGEGIDLFKLQTKINQTIEYMHQDLIAARAYLEADKREREALEEHRGLDFKKKVEKAIREKHSPHEFAQWLYGVSKIVIWIFVVLFIALEGLITSRHIDKYLQVSKVNAIYLSMKNRGLFKPFDPSYKQELAISHSARSEQLIQQKDWKNALQEARQARQLDPNIQRAWWQEGYALVELGRYLEAVAAYDMAIKLNPNDAWAWNNKGAALGRLARWKEAKDCYRRALVIDPQNEVAKRNLAKSGQ